MSTTDNADDGGETIYQESEKEAMVFAYSDGDYEDEREFLEAVFGDQVDFEVNETEEVTERNVELTLDFEETFDDESDLTRHIQESFAPWSDREKSSMARYFEDRELPEYLELTVEEETTDEHVHSERNVVEKALADVVPNDTLEGYGFEAPKWAENDIFKARRYVEDENGDETEQWSKVYAKSVEPRRELQPRAERDGCDPYATDETFHSIALQVKLTAEDCDENFMLSQQVLSPIKDALLELDAIDSVRHEECIENTRKRGGCHAL